MPLDHADYAERRLREDNANLTQALKDTILQLEIILASMQWDDRPSYQQKETAKEVIQKAKQIL